MSFRVALVGSNQHQNRYAGTTQTEEKWAQRVCAYTRPALARLGFEARIFWVAGAGSSNVDELRRALAQADAWRPDLVFSIHSDARGGDNPRDDGILMLAPRGMNTKAIICGAEVAKRMKMPNRGVWSYGKEARPIHFLARYSETSAPDALLIELGEHDGPTEAANNLAKERAYGTACAQAIAYTYGFPTEVADEMDNFKADKIISLLERLVKQGQGASFRMVYANEVLEAIAKATPGIDLSAVVKFEEEAEAGGHRVDA